MKIIFLDIDGVLNADCDFGGGSMLNYACGNSHIGDKDMEAVKNYNVHIDDKKRVTLRGAKYQYYNVREYTNGCIILEPRELTTPKSISAKTLEDMDKSIRNFKVGKVSDPINLSDF